MSSAGASLLGSFSNNSLSVAEAGFEYGTSSSSLSQTVYYNDGLSGVSGSFSCDIASLEPSTTYYFRAFVRFGTDKYVYGDTKSFATEAEGSGQSGQSRYLNHPEIPATDLSLSSGQAYSSTVTETHGSTKAYIFNTSNSRQRVVQHTFAYNSKEMRNYTMLYDYDKRCALWTSFVMHGTAYKDNGVSRNDSWNYDPAIPSSVQPDLSSAYTGYSRGHQVASEDRQTTKDQNRQTFYYSNMTPQNTTMNGSVWNNLENQVQSLGYSTTGSDSLYVVTGPIFGSSPKTCKDDSGVSCPVPDAYFKCIMKCTFNSSGKITSAQGAAFYFENNASAKRVSKTIDEIEAMTGFNLFSTVPSSIQAGAESSSYSFFK